MVLSGALEMAVIHVLLKYPVELLSVAIALSMIVSGCEGVKIR